MPKPPNSNTPTMQPAIATIASDFALARGAVSILRSGATGSIARTALTTSMGMYFLGGMHTMAANSYYWPMMYNY